MAEPRKFAEGTEVSAERSRAELEQLLRKHGASEFGVFTSDVGTIFMYRLQGRMVRHKVECPALNVAGHRGRGRVSALEQAERARESEWRRRWRALVLVCKAKLEIIASGGSTFEREFLADVLLPDGTTVFEATRLQLAESYKTGGMPRFLLGPGAQD